MAKKLVICDKCDYKGVVDVIEKAGSEDIFWDCPDCSKRHINEGMIVKT